MVLPYLIHDILEKGDHNLRVNLSALVTHLLTDAMNQQVGTLFLMFTTTLEN